MDQTVSGFGSGSETSAHSNASSSPSSAIDFLTLCHRLKSTKRKGWVNHGINGPESIADHMYRMSLMALITSDIPGVNRERCIKIAIVHDIAEGIFLIQPNMITLMGFMFLVTSALLGYIYSFQLDSPPPRWVHFFYGLLLFLYQTFDAVDGKQARRTSSSSPLGELFDHGCDAFACAFESLAFGSTAMRGKSTFWFWVISAVPFYCATWESYFTNTLILPVINGPTEGLMLIHMTHFFTAFIGAEWWAQPFGKSIPFFSWVPFINGIIMYKAVMSFMTTFAVIPTVSFNVHNVYKVVKARNENMLLALAMIYPFVVLLGGVLVWNYLSPADLMRSYPHLVVVGTGLAFGFLVGRMILAHLCDEPKGLKTNMCMSLCYLPLAIANALTARLNDGVPLVDEFWVLLGYCLYTVVLYMHFATSVIHEITSALGIYCFRITRKEA